MTLVVAGVTPDIGFLVADTFLSVEFELKGHSGPVNGEFHALKVQILSPVAAVAFAGDAETSFSLIKNLHNELRANPNIDLCHRLFVSYRQVIDLIDGNNPLDCEFLVLQLTADGRKLAHVTEDGIRSCSRGYIGDPADYERLTQLRRPYFPPKTQLVQQTDGTFRVEPLVESDGQIEFRVVSNAMEALTHQRQSSSVGAIAGCITRVVDARISGELEYLQSGEASLTPWEGNSGFSVLACNADPRGIGIYYVSGKFGFLFIVGDSEPCRKEWAETMTQFKDAALSKYGLNLVGPITPAPP